MKLVIISPFQFRLHRGIERLTFSLANALAEKGFSITVYAWEGIEHNVDWGKWHPAIKIRKVPAVRYFQSLVAGFFYRNWIRRDNPDYIFLHFLYQGENKLPAKRKYIYILNSPASQIENRYVYIQRQLKRFKNLEFVAVSQKVKKDAIPYTEGRKITTILNGVDTDLFKPRVNGVAQPAELIRIVSAAALEERKGMQYVISALGKMEESQRQKIRYDIFGEGPYKEKLQDLIHSYDLEKIVSLKQPVNNLSEVLPQYDLFCLLSSGEAFGLSILEAMACGLPILASNFEPFNEIVDEKFGACIDPKDTEGIIRFISNCKIQNYKNDWAAASREKSMNFNWEKVAEDYKNLLSCA
jgi:glycosyltransferase involved in cell wall biosynthesis